ncbi:MAG: urea carboxylase-associated family protein [Alphaproteobacteria bacterium]|nr:urea carboxylase-associated family protein [Alphaproteobacteria bacterium]
MDEARAKAGQVTARGTVVDDFISARSGGAWVVKKGQRIRIVDVEGAAICDFVCFNADNLRERFSQARTKADQGKFAIGLGDRLYSRDNNVMLTIVADTYRDHDLQWGMCSAWVFNSLKRDYHGMDPGFRVGGPLGLPPHGCYEVLQGALQPWRISPEDIPDPFNIFQTMRLDAERKALAIVDGRSKPGDYVELQAEMNALCAVSACPFAGKPLRVQIFEA